MSLTYGPDPEAWSDRVAKATRAESRASELHPHPDPLAPRICEGCGCTDEDACLDTTTGQPCSWVEGFYCEICSACFRVLVEMDGLDQSAIDERAETRDRRMFGETTQKPLVHLYGESDLDHAIREIRKGRV